MNIVFSEASGLQDSIYGKVQAPIRMFIEQKGQSLEQLSVLPYLFAMEKSNHFGEKFTSMTAMSGFQPVGENGNHPHDNMQEGYSKFLENETWKNRFDLSREIVDDSKLMDLKKQPASFVESYHATRERFGAALFAAAIQGKTFATFGGRKFDASGADGKAIFAKDHPSKVSGKAQGNVFSDAFSVNGLSAMETAMQNFRGDNDDILQVAPDTILIPNDYELKRDVFAAIGADKDPATANNGFNYQYGRWNVIVWNYLNQFLADGAKPWVLLDSKYNADYAGAVFLDRTPLEVKSRIDEDTDANVWQGYARFTAGFNDWRFAAVGGVAGGTKLTK